MSNYDRYLDPLEEPEARFCEFCNHEMELKNTHSSIRGDEPYWRCVNRFCPDKFVGVWTSGDIALEMAKYIVELEERIDDLKTSENKLNAKIYQLDNQIAELTQSQEKR